MSKYVYPALLSWNEKDKAYLVSFPDVPEAITFGYTLEEALENASDALNLIIYDNTNPPKATPINNIQKEKESDIVTLITADTERYAEIIERENNPIRYARKKAGLNIKQLADLLGAPYRTVQDWNAGRKFPPAWVQRLVIEKIETLY